jgi:CBS domain-containing protein
MPEELAPSRDLPVVAVESAYFSEGRYAMKLMDVMTRNPEVIRPDATLAEAAAKMKELDVGPLPVCDGTRLLGMITDRDLTVRATAEGRDPNTTPVKDVMTADVVTCFEDQDVREAARIMQEQQIRRLVILDRDKHLVGIVSLGDLAVEIGNDRLAGETLEQISEPSQPDR